LNIFLFNNLEMKVIFKKAKTIITTKGITILKSSNLKRACQVS